ncbi:serine hydrolase domain-containing protein [Pedobacter immunditicola]|uniref:serine hydrolase domain-containing protein n=1 Tax=Pedobacter immunditicola TaxID=3133440 RepID=UPI0030989601
MKIIYCFLLLLLSITGCKVSAPSSSTPQTSFADDAVKQMIDKQAIWLLSHPELHAASIGVFNNGKINMYHYGELDPEKGNKPTDSTIYEIASISKTFTGTLVANAVLEGRLNLEDDIRKYLKEEYPNLAFEGKPIQIKHLLTHTSALPRALPIDDHIWENPGDSLAFKLHDLAKDYSKGQFLKDLHFVKLKEVPGGAYSYSNISPNLLAHILENIYEKSFDELLEQTIFKRAGLKNTKMRLRQGEQDRLANGYNEKGVLMPHMESSLWGADGGLKSTLPDLMLYMAFQLDKNSALAQKSQEAVTATSQGYFWTVKENNGSKTVSGHGGAFGTQTWFSFYPQHNRGIVVVTNESGPNTAGIISGMLPWNSLYIDLLQQLNKDGREKAIAFYKDIKAMNVKDYHFETAENQLNELGYHLLGEKRIEDAIAIFKLNALEFATSANAFDSLGEAYLVKGNKELSLKSYKQALALDARSENAKKMIRKLEDTTQK